MSRFASDRVSGSSDVASAFLDELGAWLAVDRSPSAPALRGALLSWLRAAQAEQPSFALVHQLAARALAVADAALGREDSVASLREHLARSAAAERADLAAAREAVGRLALELLSERESWVATLSNSGTVAGALLRAQASGKKPRALVAEGRPRLEGRALAAALAEAGLPVWLVVDAAFPLLLSQMSMIWIGADAVTDRGAINKVGSYAAVLAAREHSVPVYVLAERRKFLPASTAALKITEMQPDEVWEDPPAGVKPRNVYFELVPLELIRGVVVEDAVLGPGEAAGVARERPLPVELAG